MKNLINKLSKREKLILLSVFSILIGVAYYVFEYEVLMKKGSVVSRQLTGVENTLKSIKQSISLTQNNSARVDKEKINLALSGLKNEIESLRSRLRGDPIDVLRTLKTYALGWSLEMQSLDTRERQIKVGEKELMETTLDLNLTGRYKSIMRFIDSLKKIHAALVIYNFTMEPKEEKGSTIQASVTLKLLSL